MGKRYVARDQYGQVAQGTRTLEGRALMDWTSAAIMAAYIAAMTWLALVLGPEERR